MLESLMMTSTQILTAADCEVVRESTQTIEQQVGNLRTLVNEFSQFARMPQAAPRPGDINALLDNTAAIYREAHPDIQFKLELDPSVPTLAFDREQISRAIVNLLENAIASVQDAFAFTENHQQGTVREATKKAIRSVSSFLSGGGAESGALGLKPTIVLETEFSSDVGLVLISIVDNGLGISASEIQRIFEPYYSTKGSGTGLGLAIVNTIVKDHNGFIRVRAEEPRGCRFTIELPCTREALRIFG